MSTEGAERALGELLDALEAASRAPRRREPKQLAQSVGRAWQLIADPERELGRAAREQLPASTGLSLESVAWALHAAVAPAAGPLMSELAERLAPPEGSLASPPGLAALWLAGNVFTACVRPLSLALIAGASVLVKASSRDDTLPRLFEAALTEVDAELAERCAVVSFPGGTTELEAKLLARADAIDVFGSDRTVASIRQRVRPTADVFTHGHGLGVGWVGKDAPQESMEAVARGFALDVAAYDQRGCLSPHAVFVERGGALTGPQFARLLALGLDERADELPRGELPADVGAAQLQWRGVAQARGQLTEGRRFAVSYEGDASLRLSPGYRNVAVFDAPDRESFVEALAPLGVHLKAIGSAGDASSRRSLGQALAPRLAPRISAPGAMQTPTLLAPADGRAPWERWRRYVQVD